MGWIKPALNLDRGTFQRRPFFSLDPWFLEVSSLSILCWWDFSVMFQNLTTSKRPQSDLSMNYGQGINPRMAYSIPVVRRELRSYGYPYSLLCKWGAKEILSRRSFATIMIVLFQVRELSQFQTVWKFFDTLCCWLWWSAVVCTHRFCGARLHHAQAPRAKRRKLRGALRAASKAKQRDVQGGTTVGDLDGFSLNSWGFRWI